METTARSPLRLSLVVSLALALLVVVVITQDHRALAATEDFTTWTEVDSGSDITVTSSTVTVDTMQRDAVSYVVSDEGVSAIGEFVHQFELNITASSGLSNSGVWAVGDTLGTHPDCVTNANCFRLIAFDAEPDGDYELQLIDDTDTSKIVANDFVVGTTYFVEMERASTTLTATICTVSHDCVTPVAEISTPVPTTAWRYVYAAISRNTTNDGSTISFTHANLDLVADSITITTPAAEAKIQRDIDSNNQSVTISGTYIDATDPPSAIEYRFDGGAWATLDSSPSANAFSGTVTIGSGFGNLEVRMADDTAISDAVADVGIGDIFLIAGQSNARTPATNNQAYTGVLGSAFFRLDDAWTADANDPSHSGVAGNTGSPWPLLADYIETNESTPVFFISTATSGSNLSTAPFDWTNGVSDFDTAVTQVLTDSGVDDVLAVLWHQGESDANASVSQAVHNAALDTLLTELRAEGGALSDVVIIAASIGERNPESSLNNVREAIHEAWDDNPGIYQGPVVYDLDLPDDLHYRTDILVGELADRWAESINVALYGGTQAAPNLAGVFLSTDLLSVLVDFDTDVTVADASATAWDVVDNGGNVDANITNITASGDRVTITLSTPLVEPVTVSLGDANEAAGATVPLGTGADTLPARSFITEAASLVSFLATFDITYEAEPAFNAAVPILFIIAGFAPILAGIWLLWTFKRSDQ